MQGKLWRYGPAEMLEFYERDLCNLSKDYVWPVGPGDDIEIIEKQVGGAGVARFRSESGAIVIKAKDKAPVVWALEVKKCAEAAIISFRDGECHLHLLEMKSKLTQGQLSHALIQLEGMFLSALAVARLIGIMTFASTTCYIAYKEDALNPSESADMIFMKSFVGMNNPLGGYEDWEAETLDLPLSTKAVLKKGQRDAEANIHFGEI